MVGDALLTGFNIYCDESCHLPLDGMPAMVLGAVRVPLEDSARFAASFRALKVAHGLHPQAELKWVKLSPHWEAVYHAAVDHFFDSPAVGFRAVVAHRSRLNHSKYGQTHDDWYYKMYFQLLGKMVDRQHDFRIYLDIKDTRGGPKVERLTDVLRSNMRDFRGENLTRVQTVRSHEVEALQLADILIGALSYRARGLTSSPAKLRLVEHIQARTGTTLDHNTSPGEIKFNLFHWHGSVA